MRSIRFLVAFLLCTDHLVQTTDSEAAGVSTDASSVSDISDSGTGTVEGRVSVSVRAVGLAAIHDGDQGSAFEQAKRVALRAAVEQALGTLISSHTKVQNFAVIEDHILSQTEGYVQSFEIAERGLSDAETYEVVVEARVGLGELHGDLDSVNLLIDAAGNPRVVCVGRERLLRQGSLQDATWGIAAAELERILKQASDRFVVSVLADSDGTVDDTTSFDHAKDDPRSLIATVGKDGDFVIIADVTVEEVEGIRVPFQSKLLSETGIRTALAQLQIEAFWADSHELVTSLTRVRRAAASTVEAAAQKAVRKGMEEVMN